MGKIIDLSGQRFTRLTVVEMAYVNSKRKTSMWLCKCDCGNTKVIAAHDLKHGTKSCGCLQKETMYKGLQAGWNLQKLKSKSRPIPKRKVEKHGMHKARIYTIWCLMKARCDSSKRKEYHNYGGRGIKYCDEWKSFIAFKNWAYENGYKEHLTLDRIDNDGNYEPSNCRWATIKEQSNNKRDNHFIEYKGQILTAAQWAEKLNMGESTLLTRIRRGWSIEKAITTPVKKKVKS